MDKAVRLRVRGGDARAPASRRSPTSLYAISGLRAARMQTAGMPTTAGTLGFVSGPRTTAIGRYATMLGWLAVMALLAGLVFRAIATGHGPFANMYEFSLAFAFGVLVTYMYFEHKYHQRILALVALPVALAHDGLRGHHPVHHRAARPRPPEQPPAHRPRRRRDRRLRLASRSRSRPRCCT